MCWIRLSAYKTGITPKGGGTIWYERKEMNMKLSRAELKILHILWAAEAPLTAEEIAKQTKYRLLNKEITSYLLGGLIAKKYVAQTGLYQDFSRGVSSETPLFTSTISFVDYYTELFQDISSRNLFRLCEWILDSNKLSPQMLDELSVMICNKISEV